MPAPLKLLDAFQKGEIKDYKLLHDEKKGPSMGKTWLLLDAAVYHVTGATTYIRRHHGANVTDYNFSMHIGAAIATAIYPLFNTLANEGMAQVPPLFFVLDTEKLHILNGGTTNEFLKIRVLEF